MLKALAVFLLGAASALAFAPYHWVWVLFFTFPAFLYLLSAQRAFLTGWLFGFGYFIAGLYWIAHAMFVDIARFWWALPLAVAALPAFLAAFVGFAALLTARFGGEGWRRVIFFALIWALLEWGRGHLFTGFPWQLVGNAWSAELHFAQLAALMGSYGLSLWAVLVVSLPILLLKASTRRVGAVLLVLLLGGAYGYGAWRLDQQAQAAMVDTAMPFSPPPLLRLVQPHVAQSLKIDAAALEARLAAVIETSNRAAPTPPDLIIWPETAMPYLVSMGESWAPVRQQLVSKAPLISGVVRRDMAGRYYNSLQVLDAAGEVVANYDKHHLVPFGEYIPFSQYLPFNPLGGSDFSKGGGPETLVVSGVPPFSPLICYEVIFPGAVVSDKLRPRWLLNITNDGWYGATSGPYQHFEIARLRAIEEGLPLVRVANTGISGVFDAYGRTVAATQLNEQTVLDVRLPAATAPPPYARYGDWLFAGLIVLLFSIFGFTRPRT